MANVPSTSWSETSPAGGDNLSAGDNRIREMKTQIREVIDVDHDFPSSGQATDVGQHKKVTLQEQADLGSGAEGVPIFGAQTVSGKAEMVFTDEDDNDIQFTSGGKILLTDVSLASVAGVMALIYPVGSYYFNDSDSTNPATLLGVGTWVAVEERVLVGYKSVSTEFGTAGGEYGAKTVDIAHTHSVDGTYATAWAQDAGLAHAAGTIPSGNPIVTSSAGSATTSILQPSRTVYMWRRTV